MGFKSSSEEDRIGIDLDALKLIFEDQVFRRMMKISANAVPSASRRTLLCVVEIFKRHRIGAFEAVEIMHEISTALSGEDL